MEVDQVELRAAIETYAAKIAFANITEQDIAQLNEGIERQRQALNPVDEYTFMIEDMKFHQFLNAKNDNSQFVTILDNLNNQAIIASMKNCSSPKRIHAAFDEHEKIITALKKQNKEEFIRLIEENIINGYISLTSHFRF